MTDTNMNDKAPLENKELEDNHVEHNHDHDHDHDHHHHNHDHDHRHHDHDHDHDHDEDLDEMEVIVLTLDDDTELECAVLEVFPHEEKEYIALVTLDDEQKVLLYEFNEDEDSGEIEVTMIEDEEEFNRVAEEFERIMEEYDDEDELED